MIKETPVETLDTDTTCAYCSVGCSLKLETIGDTLVKAVPLIDGAVNAGISCGKGKWGFDCAVLENKLEEPLEKVDGQFSELDYDEAIIKIAKKCQAVGTRYGKDAVGVAVSDRFTNEEAYAIKSMAEVMGARVFSMNNRKSGLLPVLGFDASPNTIDELLSTDVILCIGYNNALNPVISNKMKQAAEAGARVYVVNPAQFPQHMNFVSESFYTDNSLDFLKGLTAQLIEMNPSCEAAGIDELKDSVMDAEITDDIRRLADIYFNARKAMIVFNQNLISVEAATLIADMAVVSGHIGRPRDGILQLKAKNNSQGLVDMGITSGAEALEGLKALIVFGEEADIDTSNLEFMAVCDTHMTSLGAKADIVLPGTGFASTDGTFTNTERRLQIVQAAIDEGIELSNWEIAAAIAHVFEVDFGWEDTEDISDEMDNTVDVYRDSVIGEIYGGVLSPSAEAKLVPAGEGVFADPVKCTDSLMNVIAERLPKPVSPTL